MSSKSRNWVFTLNNYTDVFVSTLPSLPPTSCRYICVGKELAPGTGTPHLQGFIVFKNAVRFGTVQASLPGAHLEIARGTVSQCIAYCEKDGDFAEFGDRPLSASDKGNQESARWSLALSLAKAGRFDDISPQIYIGHYRALHAIHADAMVVLDSCPTTTGIWIMGPSGSGKSRAARTQFPELFPKPLNKWWDGYRDQEVVLLDDVDRSCSGWIGNFLKIWGDHYSFIAEFKGKSRAIRPKRILVTSQYSICDLFSNDPELVTALERRYRLVTLEELIFLK